MSLSNSSPPPPPPFVCLCTESYKSVWARSLVLFVQFIVGQLLWWNKNSTAVLSWHAWFFFISHSSSFPSKKDGRAGRSSILSLPALLLCFITLVCKAKREQCQLNLGMGQYCNTQRRLSLITAVWSVESVGRSLEEMIAAYKDLRVGGDRLWTYESQEFVMHGKPGKTKRTEGRPQSGLLIIISYFFVSSSFLRTPGRETSPSFQVVTWKDGLVDFLQRFWFKWNWKVWSWENFKCFQPRRDISRCGCL